LREERKSPPTLSAVSQGAIRERLRRRPPTLAKPQRTGASAEAEQHFK
jgi:hypothetical protein